MLRDCSLPVTHWFTAVTVMSTLMLSGVAEAQRSKKGQTYVTPKAATQHPAFAHQGEFRGDGLGIQVVALGEDEYQIVRYPGGLPGEGWRGSDREVQSGDVAAVKRATAELEKVVRKSPTLGKQPPSGAMLLFDGTPASLEKYWGNGAAIDDQGLLIGGCTTRETFRDFSAHVEFRTPYMPQARGQQRGNSGVYWQGRYETQVLDSFGLEGRNNECGAIYGIAAPALNMCLPPLVWQTYDVDFKAARYDDNGQKQADARLTVRLNGVVVQDDVAVPRSTTAAPVKEGATPGPIYLQDHGNPVRYRNVWVLPK